MSAHTRDEWEARGLQSSQALSLVGDIVRKANLSDPAAWVREVETRAIAEFVGYQSACSMKISGDGCRENMIVACARFGVDPLWFYTDDEGRVDTECARTLRADVAHYRIMNGLDDE